MEPDNIMFKFLLFVFVYLGPANAERGFGHQPQSYGYFQPYAVRNPPESAQSNIVQSQVVASWVDRPAPPQRSQAHLQQDFLNLFDWNQNPAAAQPSNLYSNQYSNFGRQCEAPLPYLGDVAASCPKQDFFFGMNPKHMEAIGHLKNIMMAPSTADDVICRAGQLRDRPEVNPRVWMSSLMSSVMNRPDLTGLLRPPLVEVMPSLFVNSDVLNQARQMSTIPRNTRNPTCVVLDGSVGVDNGIENTLWYWREDIMVNSNHWYWHLQHPFMPTPVNGVLPPRPDRRGELFFYFHQSILARYNAERLSNGMPKLERLELKQGNVIDQPYYAHFDGTYTGQRWGDRPPFTRVQDILFNRIPDTPVNITINNHRELVRRLEEAVRTGVMLRPDNTVVSIRNFNGIDLLGEAVEASIYSVNPGYYGAFGSHNEGHFIIGFAHDPQGLRRASPGIMTDSTTAMRDPAFYRYHTPVAAVFHDHQDSFPPHHPTQGDFPLLWQGVRIQDFRAISDNARAPNDLRTFWNHATFDLSRGLDFNRSAAQGQGPVYICAQHLDHESFRYEIKLDVDPGIRSRTATVRVFLAPKFDENGIPYRLGFQRFRFFPMDFFTVQINPGSNIISRRSVDSSLTIPWPQRLEQLERDINLQTPTTPDCGCGWPHHLLLPKGNAQGMIFDLFVMITNGEEDAVPVQQNTGSPNCRPAPIFCGVPGQLYPDSKPMGYPFDRLPYSIQDPRTGGVRAVDNLDEYTNGITNMGFTQVRITHTGEYKK